MVDFNPNVQQTKAVQVSSTTNSTEVGQAQPNSVNSYQVKSQGVGTSVEQQANYNQFGKDIANFEKFKGNDKHDAMRMTTQAANDVKVAYMQLQHDFPDVVLQFEPMPDPKTCGKKREGFITYQQQLEDWKDTTLMQINNARSIGTRQEIRGAAGAIVANDNANAAMNAAVTVATGEAVNANVDKRAEEINKNVDQEGAATRRAVHNEGAATRNVVREDGQKTRLEVRREGVKTRNAVYKEGAVIRNDLRLEGYKTRTTLQKELVETRNNTRETAQQTQELSGISEKITTTLAATVHDESTIERVNNMRNQILQSNMPYGAKKEALTHLAAFSTQVVMSEPELAEEQKRIDKKILTSGEVVPERYENKEIDEFYVEEADLEPLPQESHGTSKPQVDDVGPNVLRKHIKE